MKDELFKYFDELGDLILRIDPQAPGQDLGNLAGNGLGILEKITKILNGSRDYEHGMQRIPDVEGILEEIYDDYRISKEDLEKLKRNYCWLRYNSHAGEHNDISAS
jgi:hypothetical protein